MDKYTVYGGKVDRVIDGHMKVIVGELKKKLGANLVSVVLFGGFARGEGSVLVKKGKVVPLNDYDVVVVTKNRIEDKFLEALSLDLNKKLGIESRFSFDKGSNIMNFYTDFKNFTKEEFLRLPPLIKYYELRHSGRVLQGEDVLSKMPNYKLREVPVMDGLRDLFNRMALLVDYFRIGYFEKMSEREKETVIVFVSKAYLAICEALLIASGRFVCSYEERAKIFAKNFAIDYPKLAKELPDLAKRIDYFTEFKLKPHFDQKNPLDWWFKVRDDILIASRYFLKEALGVKAIDNKDLGKKVEDLGFNFLEPYIELYLMEKAPFLNNRFLRRIFYPLAVLKFNLSFFREVWRLKGFYPRAVLSMVDPNLRIFGVVPILLMSISRDGRVDLRLLRKACGELEKLYPRPLGFAFDDKKDLNKVYEYSSDVYRIYQFLKV